MQSTTQRWVRAAELVSLVMVVFGVTLPLLFATPLLAPLVQGPVATSDSLELILGITGGSIAGQWAAQWAILRFALRRGLRWARHASVAGLAAWLGIDVVASVITGALSPLAIIDLVALVVLGALLALAWRAADGEPAKPEEAALRGPARLVLAASVMGVGSGLMIAFAGDTRVFELWWQALGAAHYAGEPVPHDVRAAMLAFFGRIGGATAGQLVILAWMAKQAIARGERWAIGASLASVLAWFMVDSAYSLAANAAFNVVMVNVPTLVLTLPPLAWAALRLRV